jgi:hypothetical protein
LRGLTARRDLVVAEAPCDPRAMNAREEYSGRVRSGGCYALLLLPLIFPVFGVGALLDHSASRMPTTLVTLAVLAAAAAFYGLYVTECRLTIDERGARLTQQDIAFGLRREVQVLWELPLSELTSAHEVTTRTPSSRGGWIHSTVLHFPGDRKLSADAFGAKQEASSEYNRLVASLRARLGDRFTAEEKV